ncbi:uncharacterized protein O3Q21_002065 [Podargus strigoides]
MSPESGGLQPQHPDLQLDQVHLRQRQEVHRRRLRDLALSLGGRGATAAPLCDRSYTRGRKDRRRKKRLTWRTLRAAPRARAAMSPEPGGLQPQHPDLQLDQVHLRQRQEVHRHCLRDLALSLGGRGRLRPRSGGRGPRHGAGLVMLWRGRWLCRRSRAGRPRKPGRTVPAVPWMEAAAPVPTSPTEGRVPWSQQKSGGERGTCSGA